MIADTPSQYHTEGPLCKQRSSYRKALSRDIGGLRNSFPRCEHLPARAETRQTTTPSACFHQLFLRIMTRPVDRARKFIKSHGSSRIGSRGARYLMDRLGSGRVGSSHPDTTQPVKSDLTRENPCFLPDRSPGKEYQCFYTTCSGSIQNVP